MPSLNTDKAASIASMARIRLMMATYHAKLFINHDKAQTDTLKLLSAFYDCGLLLGAALAILMSSSLPRDCVDELVLRGEDGKAKGISLSPVSESC